MMKIQYFIFFISVLEAMKDDGVQMTPHLVCKTRVFGGEGNKIEKTKLFYCCEYCVFFMSSNCLSVLVKY